MVDVRQLVVESSHHPPLFGRGNNDVREVVAIGTADDVDVVSWCVCLYRCESKLAIDEHKCTGNVIIFWACWTV